MPNPLDRRVNDNPSTYIVQDRKNQKELTRLTIQDQMITTAMGGVLPEQPDPTIFDRVLDIGCGTGGWLIQAAQTYPTMALVGIDISQRLIDYASTQAHQVNDRVEFRVMDALRTLEFPDASFDLVNVRFGVSFLRTWDWPKFLSELLRITRPGGVVRITDTNIIHQSNSSALRQLHEVLQCALFRAGHIFTNESAGLTDHLAALLDQYRYQQVQTKAYAMEYRAGTVEGKAYYQDVTLGLQTSLPFYQKRGCAPKNFQAIYQQACHEMQQSDFHATWHLLTAWGSKL